MHYNSIFFKQFNSQDTVLCKSHQSIETNNPKDNKTNNGEKRCNLYKPNKQIKPELELKLPAKYETRNTCSLKNQKSIIPRKQIKDRECELITNIKN